MKPYAFITPDTTTRRPDASGDPRRPGLARRCCEYNYGLGHLVTPDVLRLYEAIDEATMFNQHGDFGAARMVAVDGPSHVGKTTSMRALAALQQREALRKLAPNATPPTPWLYYTAANEGRGKALLTGLLSACGLPTSNRDTAVTMVLRLADVAPAMGLRGIIIDDVHFLTGTKQDGLSVANIVKNVVSTVPATVVVVGMGLKKLPFMQATVSASSPSDQLARRTDWVTFRPAPLRIDDQINPLWIDIIKHLHTSLALPHGLEQFKLHHTRCLTRLVEVTGGWPGPAIHWIVRATNHAIRHDTNVDLAALAATQPQRTSP